jgi:hypothetical protein
MVSLAVFDGDQGYGVLDGMCFSFPPGSKLVENVVLVLIGNPE